MYRQGSCEVCPAVFKQVCRNETAFALRFPVFFPRRVTALQGDVVGVALDVQLACVCFYVNNVPVVRESETEVAAKKGKGKFASAYPISSPGVTRFRPAAHMYSPRASKLAQVGCCCS
jgi:hypothetical protein